MKKSLVVFLTILTLISCKDEITIVTSKQPGKIVGTVLPKESVATVQLIQGEVISTKATENGLFQFDDISPGIYRLSIKAENYGRQEIKDIKVEDGEGNDIGIIELSKFPYPLVSTTPFDKASNISAQSGSLRFEFSESIDPSSFEQALTIEPETIINRLSFSNNRYVYVYATLNFSTEYKVTLDTNLVTEFGKHLEFPVELNFTTNDFEIERIRYPFISGNDNSPLVIYFNSALSQDVENIISVDPEIPVETTLYGDSGIKIAPPLGWKADTTFNITVNQSLKEINGATLTRDTVLTFSTPKLKILDTSPINNQYYIDTTAIIQVETNYYLNEGTIKDAVSISPDVDFQIYTYTNYGNSIFRLYPSHLSPNTKYTLTINKSLTDVYGVPLNEDYIFSFTTKE